jgi:spermidine/putrescine transport system substrate-binding protein
VSTPVHIDRDRRRVIAGLVALALASGGSRPKAAAAPAVRFLDCNGGLAPAAMERFAAEAGATVAPRPCITPAQVFDALRTGETGYDLLVVPDRYVARMIFAQLLEPIDVRQLENAGSLDAAFANAQFDPGRRHSVAYLWGTFGIAYRRSAVAPAPESWQSVLDSDAHAGRIALPDEPQLAVQLALKYLGHSINTLDRTHIDAAAALLARQRPHVARFTSGAGDEVLAPGIDLAVASSAAAARAARADSDVGYVVPREGSILWQDSLCIPRGATNARQALALLDYLLRADVGAGIATGALAATPNAAARAAAPEAYRTNPIVYPPDDVLARCEASAYRGERVMQLYESAWPGRAASAH